MKMKKITILITIMLMLFMVLSAKESSLTILHVNDVHSSFEPHKMYNIKGVEGTPLGGGLQVLSGYLNQLRGEDALFMIAGDVFQGSLVDAFTKGEANVEVLNILSPDVHTIGNHELDHGLKRYKQMQEKMNFTVASANVFEANNDKLLAKTASVILKKNGIKVLVIGLLSKEYNKGEFKVIDYMDAIENVMKKKANRKVDLTILLSHAGYKVDIEIAKNIDKEYGVDLIVGGHSHTVLHEADVVNGIAIVQAGFNADYLGKVDLVVDTKKNKIKSQKAQLIPLVAGKYENDERIAAIIKKYNDMLGEEIEEVIAHLNEPLLHPSRVEETELGNFACDVLLDYFDVDLAFQNSGGLRKPIPDVAKMKNVLEAIPFRNTFKKFKITGKQLRVVLENNAKSDDWYQMPRTLSYTFDSRKPEGERVLSIKFKWAKNYFCDIALAEDLIPGSAPDVTFHLSIGKNFK